MFGGGRIFIESPLTQGDSATRPGASRRVVARVSGVFHDRGAVSTGRKWIVVQQPDVLRSLV